MRKWFLIISLLSGYNSFCQTNKIYARIEVTSVSLEEHRTWIDTSVVIILEKFGRSEIVSLGKIDSIEIGIQMELYKSNLGDGDLLVNGIAYYFKKDGKWQMHLKPGYHSKEFKTVSSIPSKMPEDYGNAVTRMQPLIVEYKEHYFIIR